MLSRCSVGVFMFVPYLENKGKEFMYFKNSSEK